MKNTKQVLFLIGAIFFLFGSFALPLMTCIQTVTTHRETQAVVTRVQMDQSSGRRGRTRIDRTLHYAFQVGDSTYQGYDHLFKADESTGPGDPVRIIYRKANPADSKVSEYGSFGLKVTITCLAVSGYLFFSFFRKRRLN